MAQSLYIRKNTSEVEKQELMKAIADKEELDKNRINMSMMLSNKTIATAAPRQ